MFPLFLVIDTSPTFLCNYMPSHMLFQPLLRHPVLQDSESDDDVLVAVQAEMA